MPAIAAAVIIAVSWVYLTFSPKVHPQKDKPAIVKEVK